MRKVNFVVKSVVIIILVLMQFVALSISLKVCTLFRVSTYEPKLMYKVKKKYKSKGPLSNKTQKCRMVVDQMNWVSLETNSVAYFKVGYASDTIIEVGCPRQHHELAGSGNVRQRF